MLHSHCLAGLEERVRYAIEEEGADVNEVDSFDSTPLYYAVYGGHESIIKLLLANGAKCDPDTFVGERCYYGALNDRIRGLLKAHNATDFGIAVRHPFSAFLRKLSASRRLHDITFEFEDAKSLTACRVVVAARAPSLRSRLSRGNMVLKKGKAARAVLEYVCTGRFGAVDKSARSDSCSFAKALRLDENFVQALDNGCAAFEDDVSFLRDSMESAATDEDFLDAKLVCDDGSCVPFPSAILRARSEFFDAAMTNFREADDGRISFEGSREAAVAVVRWCCCGKVDFGGDVELAMEVVRVSHRLLFPTELSSVASSAIADVLLDEGDANDALSALSYASLVSSEKLYDAICRVCAKDLESAVDLQQFRDAVLDSAHSIQERQATDSIPIIDDIRTAIRDLYNPLDLDECQEETFRLGLVDSLLERLSLRG